LPPGAGPDAAKERIVKIVVFKVTGLRPLLLHNPASMVRQSDGLITRKIPTPEVEAEASAYRDEDGVLYLPSIAFRSSMIGKGGGAMGRKVSKQTAAQIVSSCVFLSEERCRLIDPDTAEPLKTYEIDTRRAMVQNNGVLRSRPMLRKWACLLALELDDERMNVKLLLELLNVSDRVAGVGDFRPQKRGMFGQFQVEVLP